ncbi:MAG: hypothetical protein II882_02715 [Lachnospiraceae bacterium]|nr:hypothetical protein [Lachnospiraceae bacterium]
MSRKLYQYDNKDVRIVGPDWKIFDGEARHDSASYCQHEFGENEEALEIDGWLFYRSQIKHIRLRREGEPVLWLSRPQHSVILDQKLFAELEKKQEEEFDWTIPESIFPAVKKGDVLCFTLDDEDPEWFRMIIGELPAEGSAPARLQPIL